MQSLGVRLGADHRQRKQAGLPAALCIAIVLCCYATPPLGHAATPVADTVDELQRLTDRRAGRDENEIEFSRSGYVIPPGARDLFLTLEALHIEGVTVFSDSTLRGFYAHALGRKIALSEVFEVAYAIEQHYRDAGYMLARALVPPQDIRTDTASVQIRVVEGYIHEVSLDPSDPDLARAVAAQVQTLTSARPIDRQTLERALLLINDLPGVRARGVLRASAAEGASDLVVRLERTKYEGYFLTNNRGSEYTGPLRAMFAGAVNAPFGGPDRYEFTGLAALDSNEQHFAELRYQRFFGANGGALDVAASYGPSEPGASLRVLDLETRATRYSVAVDYPVIRSRNNNLSLRAGLQASNLDVDALGIDFSDDQLRVLHFGTYYAFEGDHAKGRSRSQISAELRHGLQALGASDEGSDNLSREAGQVDFTSVRVAGMHQRPLSDRTALQLGVKAQYAFDTLLSDEEFLVGGSTSGRGYDPSELAGEHGVAASLEYQRMYAGRGSWLKQLQAYLFYDIAAVWNDEAPHRSSRSSLASTGIGLRAKLFERVDASIEFAQPLTREVAEEGDREGRLYLQVVARL